MVIYAKDAGIDGRREAKKSPKFAQNAILHTGIHQEKKEAKMIDKPRLQLLAQITNGMSDAVIKLEEAYKENNLANIEAAKKTILEFQKKLDEELVEEK